MGMEDLPVMQLETDAPLPPEVQIAELARIKHLFPDGRTHREVTWYELPVARSPKGDVYYPIERVSGVRVVGCIRAENIKAYETLKTI